MCTAISRANSPKKGSPNDARANLRERKARTFAAS